MPRDDLADLGKRGLPDLGGRGVCAGPVVEIQHQRVVRETDGKASRCLPPARGERQSLDRSRHRIANGRRDHADVHLDVRGRRRRDAANDQVAVRAGLTVEQPRRHGRRDLRSVAEPAHGRVQCDEIAGQQVADPRRRRQGGAQRRRARTNDRHVHLCPKCAQHGVDQLGRRASRLLRQRHRSHPHRRRRIFPDDNRGEPLDRRRGGDFRRFRHRHGIDVRGHAFRIDAREPVGVGRAHRPLHDQRIGIDRSNLDGRLLEQQRVRPWKRRAGRGHGAELIGRDLSAFAFDDRSDQLPPGFDGCVGLRKLPEHKDDRNVTRAVHRHASVESIEHCRRSRVRKNKIDDDRHVRRRAAAGRPGGREHRGAVERLFDSDPVDGRHSGACPSSCQKKPYRGQNGAAKHPVHRGRTCPSASPIGPNAPPWRSSSSRCLNPSRRK